MPHYLKNENPIIVGNIERAIERNNGQCPCKQEGPQVFEDLTCPCLTYREKGYCCCGLYQNENV